MIKTKITREPKFFQSSEAKEIKDILNLHYSQRYSERSQSKFPVFGLGEKLYEIKKDLVEKTNSKCAYCESRIELSETIIDSFRPKDSAADENGKISADHYWWLVLRWNNLLPSCGECNANKSNYFPVNKKRATVKYYSKETLFNIESPVFIDPEFENPEEYFYYNESGRISSDTLRGNKTIEFLNLNRPNLVSKREEVWLELEEKFSFLEEFDYYNSNIEKSSPEFLKLFEQFTNYFDDSDSIYLGLRRFFIRERFKVSKNEVVRKFVKSNYKRRIFVKRKSDDRDEYFPRTEINRFEIDQIAISNYKSIDKLLIKFNRTQNGKAGWAILIGENGVGKSSTLAATIKALIGRSYYKWRFEKTEVKRSQNEIGDNENATASINISFKNLIPESVSVGSKVEYFLPKNYFLNSSIIAFGPFKHSNKDDRGFQEFKGTTFISNFFDPAVPLHNSTKFILQLSNEQFEYVAIGILDLLMLENKARIHRDLTRDMVWFTLTNSKEKHFFEELSDGYKSIITLGCNIIEVLLLNNESIENASGFVLIDEIGANLHPRWKMQIVKRLRRTFPNVQFLVTTHDPLCLKGIEKDETYVLRSNDGKLEVINDLPNPSDLRADQLLTSEFFGLFSTVDPEIENKFKEYYELLYKNDSSKVEKEKLTSLKDELRLRNHLGDSLREELLYVAIDTILAEHQRTEQSFSRIKVEKQVKEKAIDLIDEFLNDLE